MNDKELNDILLENRRLRAALTEVAAWEIPKVSDRHGRLVSYGFMHGSNGEREYIRTLAANALKNQ